MPVRPSLAITAGALISGAIALMGASASDQKFSARLDQQAALAIAEQQGEPITARFTSSILGLPTRHPLLSGGESVDEATRDSVAKAVAHLPGVGGTSWSDGSMMAEAGVAVLSPTHCQQDVQTLLQARTIRFQESSSDIMISSDELLDEVAAALRPCLGNIISITGHTDSTGPEPENMALSLERAQAVRSALMARGIPARGMRANGVGSAQPLEGFIPEDPINRRIEFAVVSVEKLKPTPIDTPGPR